MPSEDHSPGQCLEMFQKLSEYIDDELDGPFRTDLEHHLEECTACRICLATLKKTVSLCRHMDNAPVPEGLSTRLTELVQNLQNNPSPGSHPGKTSK